MMYFSKSDIQLASYISFEAFDWSYNNYESLYLALMTSPTEFKLMTFKKRLGKCANVANILESAPFSEEIECSETSGYPPDMPIRQSYLLKIYSELKLAVLINVFSLKVDVFTIDEALPLSKGNHSYKKSASISFVKVQPKKRMMLELC